MVRANRDSEEGNVNKTALYGQRNAYIRNDPFKGYQVQVNKSGPFKTTESLGKPTPLRATDSCEFKRPF
jgi:hypothetical protein